jgi:hypothetical protein
MLSELRANATVMKQANSDAIGTLTDDQTKALKYDVAYNDLSNDLISFYKFTTSDLDAMTSNDLYWNQLQLALMYRQLYYYYFENDDYEGRNRFRMNEYKALYDTKLKTLQFTKLTSQIGTY